jgi:ketosteroid isomerase-like protein
MRLIILITAIFLSSYIHAVGNKLEVHEQRGKTMSLKSEFVTYLQNYSDKDLVKISEMFADDITLRDWKISVSGKKAAIAETEKNFNSAKTIKIEIINIYESADSVAGELRIVVNDLEVLYVIDVVEFNNNGKIKSVRAYIGRSD